MDFKKVFNYNERMFSEEMKSVLVQVITSWQVIITTLVILIFIAIINRAARSHYLRKTPPPEVKPTKGKKEEAKEDKVDDSELHLEE